MAYKKFEHYPLKMILCRSDFLILQKINRMFCNDSIFLYDIDDNRLVNNTIHTWTNEKIVTNDTILKNGQ